MENNVLAVVFPHILILPKANVDFVLMGCNSAWKEKDVLIQAS